MENIKVINEQIYYKDGAFCVVEKDKKYLFQKRKDNGKWDLPGGGIEDGEDPLNASIRELYEETGIELKDKAKISQISKLVQKIPNKAQDFLKTDKGNAYLFYTKINIEPELKLNEEVIGFKWFSKKEFLNRKEEFTLGSVGIFNSFLETKKQKNTCSIGTIKSYLET